MPRTDRIATHIAIGAIAIVISGQAPDNSQLKGMAQTAAVLATIATTAEIVSRDV